EVLTTHRDKLVALAEKLVAEETVDSDGFEAFFTDLPAKENVHGIPTIVGPGQPIPIPDSNPQRACPADDPAPHRRADRQRSARSIPWAVGCLQCPDADH